MMMMIKMMMRMMMRMLRMMMISSLWFTAKVKVGGGLRITHSLALFPPPRQDLEFWSRLTHQPAWRLMMMIWRRRRQDLDRPRAAADKFPTGGDTESWTWSRSKVGEHRR